MNKLAVLAFSTLAILGGLLWYVAGSSLNPYLAQYANEIQKRHPNVLIRFGETELNNQQGIAYTKDVAVSTSESESTPSLKLNDIVFNYDPKSFKKGVVQIKEVNIKSATLSLSRDNLAADAEQFNNAIISMFTNNAPSNGPLGLTEKKEATVAIAAINITSVYVTLFDGNEPQQEQVFNQVKIVPELNEGVISYTLAHSINDIFNKGVLLVTTSEL